MGKVIYDVIVKEGMIVLPFFSWVLMTATVFFTYPLHSPFGSKFKLGCVSRS